LHTNPHDPTLGPLALGFRLDDFPEGKQLAQRIIPELESKEKPALTHDSSTNNLIYQYRKLKERL
jgi:hypothetical protein